MYAATAAAKSLQLCLTLCDPIDGSPPGSRQEHWSGLPFPSANQNPHIHGQFMTEELRIYSGGRTVSSGSGVGKAGQSHEKE